MVGGPATSTLTLVELVATDQGRGQSDADGFLIHIGVARA
jgi:hypothetical protein